MHRTDAHFANSYGDRYPTAPCAVCEAQCEANCDGLCQCCAAESAALDLAWDEGWDETPATSLAVVAL